MPFISVHSRRFKLLVQSRIIRVRHRMNWTQPQMARALDIPTERYKSYEYKAAMPFHIMVLFCDVTNTPMERMGDRNATEEEMEYIIACESKAPRANNR